MSLREFTVVPGIDYNRLRAAIRMEQVLDLLHFQPTQRGRMQWYGACPLHEASPHESRIKRSRVFSVNVTTGRYYCHKCHSYGNALELWAAAIKLPLHPASIELCKRLGLPIPWISR
jgi:hypothetical protein